MEKREYVAGFLFNDTGTMVTLVEKKKFPPGVDWSKNPLNGIGGKIEKSETPIEAMVREFREETGVEMKQQDWDNFATLCSSTWVVYFFKAFSSEHMSQTQTMEEEKIGEVATSPLYRVVPNLKWLIPLALEEAVKHASICERD